MTGGRRGNREARQVDVKKNKQDYGTLLVHLFTQTNQRRTEGGIEGVEATARLG